MGSGIFYLGFSPGLSVQWTGLSRPEPEAAGVILAASGYLLLWTAAGLPPFVLSQQEFDLWDGQYAPSTMTATRAVGSGLVYEIGGTVEVICTVSATQRTRIGVCDTGNGLPPEKLSQLFQPFNRLGQESGSEEGTGIGLVVSKRLVELMGGEIGAQSTVGVGSVFWIELHATQAPKLVAVATELKAPVPARAPSDAPLHTLLCVEDNPANLMLVEKVLERRPDIRLLVAKDGIRGVETARAARPDVILMDINLPGISGLVALGILAQDSATASIPVIALSANAMPGDIEKGLAAGFFRYLTKPIKVNEFMDSLNNALAFAEHQAGRACTRGAP